MKKLILSLLISSFSIVGFAQNLPNIWFPASGTDTYTTNISNFGGNYANKIAYVKFANTNTGASTINIGAIGAAPLRYWDGSAWQVLTAGYINTTFIYRISYITASSYFGLEKSDASGGGGGTVTSVTSANGAATIATTTTTPVITIVSAPILSTARNIQGVAFDGSANINPINGTGFVKTTGTTLSYDNSTYATQAFSNALVADVINDGVTTIAPSQNAVFDADVLKANISPASVTYSATGTLALSDLGKTILASSASAINITVPPNSSVAFPIGASIPLIQTGTGLMTIVAGAAVTLNGNLVSNGQNNLVFLYKISTDTWQVVNGTTLTANNGIQFSAGVFSLGNALTSDTNLSGTKNLGLGIAPLSTLHLRAGTATANTAPLQFTSGTTETTARTGVVEFNTDDLFFTITTSAARKAFILDDGARLTAGRVPFATTNGRLTNQSGFSFASSILTVPNLINSGLTTTRLTFATTSGQLTDDADFTVTGGNTLNTTQLNIGTGTTITKYISASSTLDFASTSAQSSSDLTITLTGAVVGDIVMIGIDNASTLSNSCFTARVSAVNTVSIRFNNYSSAAQDPASGTFKVAIIK